MRFLLIIAALFLSACNSTQNLSVYSFTNSEVESVLKEQLPKLSEKVNLMGLSAQFDVNNLSVNIGPDKRDVVALALDTSAQINAFTFKYPVQLKLQIEGQPFYDSKEKAVFIRDIKLLDSSLDAAGFKGNLGLLNNEAMNIINAFLVNNPVYRLNMDNPKVAFLSQLPLNLQVVEGAIKLVPQF